MSLGSKDLRLVQRRRSCGSKLVSLEAAASQDFGTDHFRGTFFDFLESDREKKSLWLSLHSKCLRWSEFGYNVFHCGESRVECQVVGNIASVEQEVVLQFVTCFGRQNKYTTSTVSYLLEVNYVRWDFCSGASNSHRFHHVKKTAAFFYSVIMLQILKRWSRELLWSFWATCPKGNPQLSPRVRVFVEVNG